MVQMRQRSTSERLPDDDVPALGPNPAIRRAWSDHEERELRWWVVVLLAAVAFSVLALYAVR
jgi:hypothetical protein